MEDLKREINFLKFRFRRNPQSDVNVLFRAWDDQIVKCALILLVFIRPKSCYK